MSEPSVNLAIMMSIASSLLKKPIDDKTVFIAEVGLTGELKKVPQIKQRIKELERLGYKKCFVAKNSVDENEFSGIGVLQKSNIRQVIDECFR